MTDSRFSLTFGILQSLASVDSFSFLLPSRFASLFNALLKRIIIYVEDEIKNKAHVNLYIRLMYETALSTLMPPTLLCLTSQEEASCLPCRGCKGGSPYASSQAHEQQQSSAEDEGNRWHVLECLPLQRFLKIKYFH